MVFRWTSGDGTQAGDTWLWRRTDTGDEERTSDTTVTVDADERVCVQVRLIRGSFALPGATHASGDRGSVLV